MKLDPAPLRTFLEAARAGSYTRAAERLHVSQSAVSHAMRRLEDQLGLALVEWRGRELHLTEDGRYLRQVCERVFDELDRAEARLAERRDPVTRVTLGAPVEFGTTVLIRRVAPLLEAHPGLHVDFHFSNELVGPLLDGELDLAVDCVPHRDPAVDSTPLFREDYAVVAAPSLLARHPLPSPVDLGEVPVLSLDREGRWWQRVLDALPPGGRPVLRRIVGVDQLRGIIHGAIDGLGVGLVPRYTVLDELGSGALVALFEDVPLLADWFSVVQLRSRAQRRANRLVTAWLDGLDPGELGAPAVEPGRLGIDRD